MSILATETLRLSAPYVAAALAGVVTERAGVINVALEGGLVVGGVACAAAAIATGSPALGVVAACVVASAFCALHGVLSVRARVNVMVSSIALNLVAAGLARYALRVLYDSASSSKEVPAFGARASEWARVVLFPPFLAVAVAVPLVALLLARTRFGLRLRAVGEAKEAARALGIDVDGVQIAATAVSGAVLGLGAAHLVLEAHRYDAGMTAGRGFLALAAVILGRWRPFAAAAACLLFGLTEALSATVQDKVRLPSEVVTMGPYLVTLVVLVVTGRRAMRLT